MSTWNVSKKVSGVWTADGTIPRPQADFPKRKISTQMRVALADGSRAFLAPSTKHTDEQFTFVWISDDGTVKDKIEGYIEGQDDIKITDHLANEYIGRFISSDATWRVGLEPDAYTVTAVFEQMPGLS